MKLLDGKGRGHEAEVDDKQRVSTLSTSQSILKAEAEEGGSFGIGTPHLTTTVTGGHYLYFKNTSTSHFHAEKVWFNYDGGATNHDKTARFIVYLNPSAPSANNTAGAATNLNFSSGKTADMTVEYWDEVGDGMTIATAGTAKFFGIVRKGVTPIEVDGALLLGPEQAVSIQVFSEEVGEFNITIMGYFEDHS